MNRRILVGAALVASPFAVLIAVAEPRPAPPVKPPTPVPAKPSPAPVIPGPTKAPVTPSKLPTVQPSDCDFDGDGFESRTCGGADCDDRDRDRYPGNSERCDGLLPDGRSAADHDEDCNPCTIHQAVPADGDADADGIPASTCTNPWTTTTAPAGCDAHISSVMQGRVIGNDCDDTNVALVPGSQICSGDAKVNVCGGPPAARNAPAGRGGAWQLRDCPTVGGRLSHCVPQPNGTGVCVD